MKNKLLILGIAMSGLAISQTDSTCVGTTSKGLNCKIKVNIDSTNLCHYHNGTYVSSAGDTKSVTCGGTTSKNLPCKLKTKHESGKCHHHRTK